MKKRALTEAEVEERIAKAMLIGGRYIQAYDVIRTAGVTTQGIPWLYYYDGETTEPISKDEYARRMREAFGEDDSAIFGNLYGEGL